MKTLRVLPPDVFDALELSALVHGGIGAFYREYDGAPHCLAGHLQFVGAIEEGGWPEHIAAGIGVVTNDGAVTGVVGHVPAEKGKRISFKRWCKELNVIRGE